MNLGVTAPTDDEVLLLRSALLDRPFAVDSWRDWRARCTVQGSHPRVRGILPLVAANLPDETLGPDRAVLRGLRRRAWLVREQQRAVLSGVLSALEDAGIDATPILASWWLVAEGGRSPERPVEGNALWVRPGSWAAAVRLLSDHGWRAADRPWPLASATRLLDADANRLDLSWGRLFPRLARVVPGEPTPPVVLVESLLAGGDQGPDEALLWPVDAALLIDGRDDDAGFWEEVTVTAGAYGQGEVVAAALTWLRERLGLAVPVDAVDAVTRAAQDPLLAEEGRRAAEGHVGPTRRRRSADLRAARAAGEVPADWPRFAPPRQLAGRAMASIQARRRSRTRRHSS